MKVLHLHPGPDTGGQSVGGKRILEAAGHEVRIFTRSQHCFGYAATEVWEHPALQTLVEPWEWADLVVIHNETRDFGQLAQRDPKPLIVHHHGSRFRRRPKVQYEQAAHLGALQVVSTVDLLTFSPGPAYWQPQNVDLPKMATIRAEHYEPGEKVRVAHMPTNRQIKGTAHVMMAARALDAEVELVMPRHMVPWERCLAMKATADLYADQFLLGYGNNAIEAWAMRMPVIAGAEPPILERMRHEWGAIPFYATHYRHLLADLRDLAGDPVCRREWADRGWLHLQRYHAPKAWLARFEELAGLAGVSRHLTSGVTAA